MPIVNSLVLLLHSNLISNSSLVGGFSIQFIDNSAVSYFLLGPLDLPYPTADWSLNWCHGRSCSSTGTISTDSDWL